MSEKKKSYLRLSEFGFSLTPIVKRHLFRICFSILQITEKLRDKNFALALS